MVTQKKGRSVRCGEETVAPGTRTRVEIPVSRLPGGSWLNLPVAVVNGAHAGKAMWLCGAIHGDELNGIEIIREILSRLNPERLSGTVLAVPMVNMFGVLQGSRYLPDRRDLNRSFPGSKRGSLASRLAHLLMREVISKCKFGIDFHTGSNRRTNLPQIRVEAGNREASRLANVFGAPVVFHAPDRKGSLRWAASRAGVTTLLYEGGEALSFDESVIEAGVAGALRVMKDAGMIARAPKLSRKPVHCSESVWVRAKAGGVCRIRTTLGDHVRAKETVALVSDAFNAATNEVVSPISGIVIGLSKSPLVNSGDALVHIGKVR